MLTGNLNRFNRFAVIITFANSHFVSFNLVNFSVGMPLNKTVEIASKHTMLLPAFKGVDAVASLADVATGFVNPHRYP
jgi:hypothetical protein